MMSVQGTSRQGAVYTGSSLNTAQAKLLLADLAALEAAALRKQAELGEIEVAALRKQAELAELYAANCRGQAPKIAADYISRLQFVAKMGVGQASKEAFDKLMAMSLDQDSEAGDDDGERS